MSESNHSLFHRLAHTPMRDVLRFRITARLDWRGMIKASGLPVEIQSLIVKVVHRTRLWRLERADVARELIAHFQDGIAANRSADELIKAFGDPKAAAKLIRRAKKRSRPLAWHFARRCTQAFGVLVLIYFIAWMVLINRKPVVSVDYAEKMLAPMNAAKPDEKGWPIYRQAWIDNDIWNLKFPIVGTYYSSRYARPGDAAWPQTQALLEKHRSLLDAARRGAERRYSGIPAGFLYDLSEEEAGALVGKGEMIKNYTGRRRPSEEMRVRSEPLFHVLLPGLGTMRMMTTLLSLDSLAAGERGDSARIVANHRAMLGLARQARGTGWLIEQFVAISIVRQASDTIADILHERPGAISDDDLIALAHETWAARDTCAIDLTVDKWIVLDAIQRTYSDDGHGGGRVTLDGLKFMRTLTNGSSLADPVPGLDRQSLAIGASLPAIAMTLAERHELTEKVESHFARSNEDLKLQLWEVLAGKSKSDEMIIQLRTPVTNRLRYALLTALMPALGASVRTQRLGEARAEAATVVIALELYRRREGRYPESLAQLVPRYVPAPLVDHSTGEPLLMKILDGKPVVYGRGLNKTDDGGVRITTGVGEGEIPKQGDWILYPPLIELEVVPGVAPATQPAS